MVKEAIKVLSGFLPHMILPLLRPFPLFKLFDEVGGNPGF